MAISRHVSWKTNKILDIFKSKHNLGEYNIDSTEWKLYMVNGPPKLQQILCENEMQFSRAGSQFRMEIYGIFEVCIATL